MAQWVDVNEDFDQQYACPNKDVNESENEMGWGRCRSHNDCYGFRECSAYGICLGKDYCNEDLPDFCTIDESLSSYGPGRCG